MAERTEKTKVRHHPYERPEGSPAPGTAAAGAEEQAEGEDQVGAAPPPTDESSSAASSDAASSDAQAAAYAQQLEMLQQQQQQRQQFQSSAGSTQSYPGQHGGEDLPSKVLHFRNVTPNINKNDLLAAISQFGNVSHVVMMRANNQALVEMADKDSAVKFIQYHSQTPCQINGRRVYSRFSRHQELHRKSDCSPNRIILVTLQAEYSLQNLNIDVVYQVFSTYGNIEKLVLIRKDAAQLEGNQRLQNSRQALIQYSMLQSANQAMETLNGQTVYVGQEPMIGLACTVQYSNLPELSVKQQGPDSRDYTQMGMGMAAGGFGGYAPPYGMPPQMMGGMMPGMMPGMAMGGMGMGGMMGGGMGGMGGGQQGYGGQQQQQQGYTPPSQH